MPEKKMIWDPVETMKYLIRLKAQLGGKATRKMDEISNMIRKGITDTLSGPHREMMGAASKNISRVVRGITKR